MPKMKAVFFHKHGGLEKLKYDYLPTPKPGKREVLVKVNACALNHLDLWTLMGRTGVKVKMPHILGCDVAGEIIETGPKAKKSTKKRVLIAPGIQGDKRSTFTQTGWDSLAEGYKILGLQTDGGYAEYVKVPEDNIIPISGKLSDAEWASIPLVSLTAYHMLITRAQLQKGERVLIHAAGSGVGSMAIQIAKSLGATVITTVGSDYKVKAAKSLGADHVINYKKKDFAEEVRRITRGVGVEVVLEHIGPETFQKSLASLKKKGRLVTCGVTSGPTVSFDLRFVFSRQLSILGCYMGGIKELKKVVSLVEKKKIKPVVDKTFPLREAPTALQRMVERKNFGKIVLSMS